MKPKNKKIDCLLIGHNEMNLSSYEKMVKAQGEHSGAFRDLRLSLLDIDHHRFTVMELLNYFRYEGQLISNPNQLLKQRELSPAIAYLASYLQRRHFSFDYINSFQEQKEELIQKLTENHIMAIAVTTTLYVTVSPILEILSLIRTYNRTAKIIVGGPFMLTQSIMPGATHCEAVYKTIDADFYVIESQGEYALTKILEALAGNLSYHDIPNIVYKQNSSYQETVRIPENNPLEQNMVDWTLFSRQDIGSFVSTRTSISCPYSCTFCGFPQRAGKYRTIAVETLEQNLDLLESLGTVQVLHFIDDTFNVPPERFKSILRMMIRKKYSFKWHSMYRCQFADDETTALMKESGCQGVFLGVESASDTILAKMNKHACIDAYRKGIELLNQYGIITYASFIIGFPGETDKTAGDTLRFIRETGPTFFRTQLWYYDPITPIREQAGKYKIKGSAFNWSHQTMNWEQACDWIDEIFLIFSSGEHSTWLPQYKFEPNNLYYLLNKGMTLAQVKDFLKYFNLLSGRKLNSPRMHMSAADEVAIVDRLKQICKFNCRDADELQSTDTHRQTIEKNGFFGTGFDFA